MKTYPKGLVVECLPNTHKTWEGKVRLTRESENTGWIVTNTVKDRAQGQRKGA